MNVKPIRDSDDLVLAQEQLAALIRKNQDGRHDDEIDVLSALIEHYERNRIQFDAPSAVAAIRFRMSELGLTPRQLEPYVGSRARVWEVLSGKRSLSIDMIRSLHDGLGIPYASLISKETISDGDALEAPSPAVARLNALGFDVDQRNISSFVKASMKSLGTPALLRKTRSARAASKTDQSALILWQAAVLKKAADVEPSSAFDRSRLDDSYLRGIARLSLKAKGPLHALRKLEEIGVYVVIMPPLPGTFLDGAAMLSAQGVPIVALTLRYDRTDNFWFTLMHELCHLRLHFDDLRQKDFVFFDDMDIQSEDAREREADDLAQRSLIPESILRSVHWDASSSTSDIVAVSNRARVHVSISAGRWQRDHQNYRRFARLVQRDTLRPLLMP
jgi:HTH-type transcriptional regulator / antitoxin HigA